MMTPKCIHTHIFQACHHHKLAAHHQSIIHMHALFKQWFYWCSMQNNCSVGASVALLGANARQLFVDMSAAGSHI